jgi:MFS superfamily sulfate permease-like transporter
MRMLSSLVAVVSLFLTVAFVPLVGGVLFAMVAFGLFLLALVAVLAEQEDRTVRQHNPSMNPRGWRDGS